MLKLANSFLAAIVESSDDAIISKDLNGLFTPGTGGRAHLGYSPEEAIGQPATFLFRQIVLMKSRLFLDKIRHGQRVEHYETISGAKMAACWNISLNDIPD